MPLDIGIGLSTEKDYRLAAKEAVREASINMAAEKIDVAIVFSSRDLASAGLLKGIVAATGGAPLTGCSATALITEQGILKHGLAVILLNVPEGIQITTGYARELRSRDGMDIGRELSEKLLSDFKETRRVMSLVFADGSVEDTAGLIAGMQERLGKIFPILAGAVSLNTQSYRTYLYFNQDVLMDSALGLLWGGRASFGLGSRHGWKPLGKPRTVTRSHANTVEEIDGEYALKMYEDYFGTDAAELKKSFRIISMLYPLGINTDDEEEHLLRNPVAIGENGSLRFQAGIKQGNTVKLMIATKETCLNATRQAAEESYQGLVESGKLHKGPHKNIVFIFESLSRQMVLKQDIAEEVKIIKGVFGEDTPVIGIYTYGEQAPLNIGSYYRQQTYFHNQAVSILSIGG